MWFGWVGFRRLGLVKAVFAQKRQSSRVPHETIEEVRNPLVERGLAFWDILPVSPTCFSYQTSVHPSFK